MKNRLIAVCSLVGVGACIISGNLVAVSIVANGAAMAVRHDVPGKWTESAFSGHWRNPYYQHLHQ